VFLQSDVRALFVHARQTAITGNIGREYGCKLSILVSLLGLVGLIVSVWIWFFR
jgi:hypothetical protein